MRLLRGSWFFSCCKCDTHVRTSRKLTLMQIDVNLWILEASSFFLLSQVYILRLSLVTLNVNYFFSIIIISLPSLMNANSIQSISTLLPLRQLQIWEVFQQVGITHKAVMKKVNYQILLPHNVFLDELEFCTGDQNL